MTNNKQSTRYFSRRQENRVAKEVGGKVVANSGATAFHKGDVSSPHMLVECKTQLEHKKSFTIKKEWLDKNKEEAFAMGKDYSVLAFDFGPDEETYYVIDRKTMRHFIQMLEEGEDE